MPYALSQGRPIASSPTRKVGLLACLSFEANKNRAWAVLFVFAYSSLMELFQYYLPYRHGTWDDVWLNGMGCLAGAAIFAAVAGVLGKR